MRVLERSSKYFHKALILFLKVFSYIFSINSLILSHGILVLNRLWFRFYLATGWNVPLRIHCGKYNILLQFNNKKLKKVEKIIKLFWLCLISVVIFSNAILKFLHVFLSFLFLWVQSFSVFRPFLHFYGTFCITRVRLLLNTLCREDAWLGHMCFWPSTLE